MGYVRKVKGAHVVRVACLLHSPKRYLDSLHDQTCLGPVRIEGARESLVIPRTKPRGTTSLCMEQWLQRRGISESEFRLVQQRIKDNIRASAVNQFRSISYASAGTCSEYMLLKACNFALTW